MLRNKIFVDTETSGLDYVNDQLIELSWAVNRGPIKTLYFGVTEVSEEIDNLIKFYERGIHKQRPSTIEEVQLFKTETEDQTVVAANRYFDQRFLQENGLWTAHYRAIEIESYAMAKLGLDDVPGMKTVYDELVKRGYSLPAPNHSSYGDVDTMRRAFYILESI